MRTSRSAGKVLLALILSLSLLCITAATAFAASASPARPAHAKVISSDPAIGSTVTSAPTKVTVTTAEEMDPDPAKSNLVVYGPGDEATSTVISQGDAKVSLSEPTKMSVDIKPTSGHVDGVYVVVWKTVSTDDGDEASGAFTFTVNTSGTSVAPTPTPAPSTASNNTSTSSGTPIWVPIVAALVALVVGLGAGLGLGRRKPSASAFSSLRSSVAEEAHKNEEAGKRG